MADSQEFKYNVTMTCGGCSGAVNRVLDKAKTAGEVEDFNVCLNGNYVTVKVPSGTIKKQGGTDGPVDIKSLSDEEKEARAAEDPIFVKISKTGKKTQAWSALTDTEVEHLAKEEARKNAA